MVLSRDATVTKAARVMANHARVTATVVRDIALVGTAMRRPARIMANHAGLPTIAVTGIFAIWGTAAADNIVISSIVLNLL